LPPAEIDFSAFPDGKPRIVGHAAKWNASSFEYNTTERTFKFPASDEQLLRRLSELTLECWRLFGLSGYARVDFRCDANGQPWILEINPNPCLLPDAGFAAALEQAGIGYDSALQRILEDALARGQASPRGRVFSRLESASAAAEAAAC
jgi:D-alanine-D-alanine ligase